MVHTGLLIDLCALLEMAMAWPLCRCSGVTNLMALWR
jgi:hypothetical protein